MADENRISTTVELDVTKAQQEIVKLNAVASNSTKTLEERIQAKNKAVELQNKIAQQQIDTTKENISNTKIEISLLIEGIKEEKARSETLKNSITKRAEYQRALKNVENATKELSIKTKDLTKSQKDLEKQELALVKSTSQAEVAQDKLNEAYEDGESATKQLDDATGGLITKFKALATNPIAIFIGLIVGLFKLLQNAVGRSEKATASFNIVMAKVNGVLNGITAALEIVVEFLGDKLVKAFDDPKQAIKDFGNFLVENLTNRIKSFLVLGDAIVEFFKGNFKKAGKLALDGILQMTTGVANASDKLSKFYKEAEARYNKAAQATEALANAERRLLELRYEQEKQMLVYLRLAEVQRQIRDNESLWIGDRIEANEKLGKILDKQLQSELRLAQEVLNIARLRKVAEGSTTENLEKEKEAQLKIFEIEERITGQRSEQLVNRISLQKAYQKVKDDDLKSLSKQADEDFKAEEERLKKLQELKLRNQEANIQQDEAYLDYLIAQGDLINEKDLARQQQHGENVLALQLALLERRKQQELQNKELTEAEKLAIEDAYNYQSLKLTEASEFAKRKAVNDTANQGIDALADVFGVAKEVEIARAIMAAPQAIAQSFKNAAATYAPPLSIAMGALGAAATVVPIVKGLSDIKKTRFPKTKRGASAGSSGSSGDSGGSASTASTAVTTSSISSIANNNSARLGIDPSLASNANSNASNKIIGSSSQNIIFSENSYQNFQKQVRFKEEKTQI